MLCLVLFVTISGCLALFWAVLYKAFHLDKTRLEDCTETFNGNVKTCCVVGAGSSGIAVAKELAQVGFDVTVFEQGSELGGNWLFNDLPGQRHASVYRNTHINTSRQMMSFSDFPMPNHLPFFPHHSTVLQYFKDYAKKFNLYPLIKFNHTVQSIIRNPSDGQGYLVTVNSPEGQKKYVFDSVQVANGHHWSPNYPEQYEDWKKDFKGKMFHAHDYRDFKNPVDCTGKRVLVLGAGNSAIDVAVDLARVASVSISSRTFNHVYPKFLPFGVPLDQFAGRWFRVLPGFLQALVFKMLLLCSHGDMKRFGFGTTSGIFSFPAIGSEFVNCVTQGSVRVRPKILTVGERKVKFIDESEEEFDIIVICTGYNLSFPFLKDSPELQPFDQHENDWTPIAIIKLYRHLWIPNIGPTFSFIALVQPIGATMPIAEMQGRWLGAILSKTGRMPSSTDCVPVEPQVTVKRSLYVRTTDYIEEMAEMLGARPRWWKRWTLLPELLFGPTTPSQYRLDGPSPWRGAEGAIRKAYAEFKTSPYV